MAHTRRIKQTYLGSSDDQKLILVSWPYPVPEVRKDCFIARLPDELIAAIVELLPPHYCYFGEGFYGSSIPIPILLVCKRWHDIYNGLIYRNISLYGQKWLDQRSRRLLQRLDDRPSLNRHVRELDIYFSCLTPAAEQAVGTKIVAKCLSGLRSLKLGRLAESPLPTILFYALQMQNLKYLEFTRGFRFSTPETVAAIQKLLSLPTLSNYYEHGRNSAVYHSSETSPEQELEQVQAALPADRHQNMTSIKFGTPDVRPQSMEVILHWPACLTKLSLTYLAHSYFYNEYTLAAIQGIIDVHRTSLQHVELGHMMSESQLGVPDFSAFPSLRSLSLPERNLSRCTPSKAAARVATPALRQLMISFATEDQHMIPPSCFDADKAAWIAEFAKYIAAGRAPTNGSEDVLEVSLVSFGDIEWELFDVDDGPPDEDLSSWKPWPWKHVEQAEKMVAKCPGLSLTYSTEGWTPESWLEKVKKSLEVSKHDKFTVQA